MSISTTDNNAFFPDNARPVHQPEATRSWWLDAASRSDFQEAAIRERLRMSRSREAKSVSGTFIVGHVGRAK